MEAKSKTLKRHVRRRMSERHGIQLTREDEKSIIKDIQKFPHEIVKFIEKQSNRVTVWDVEYKNKIIRVIYDKIRKQLITVLSDEMRLENDNLCTHKSI